MSLLTSLRHTDGGEDVVASNPSSVSSPVWVGLAGVACGDASVGAPGVRDQPSAPTRKVPRMHTGTRPSGKPTVPSE